MSILINSLNLDQIVEYEETPFFVNTKIRNEFSFESNKDRFILMFHELFQKLNCFEKKDTQYSETVLSFQRRSDKTTLNFCRNQF